MPKELGPREEAVMAYLHEHVFDPILESKTASAGLKKGIRLTIMRLMERDAKGMVHYYWSAISGTDRSIRFADEMRNEGFIRFEETIEDFRRRFDDRFLRGAQA